MIIRFLLFACVLFIQPQIAWAEVLIVIRSDLPELAVGQLVENGSVLNIPGASSVTLMNVQGRTKSLVGPFNGKVQMPASAASESKGLQVLSELLRQRREEVRVIGGVRNGTSKMRSEHDLVPQKDRHFCLRGNEAEISIMLPSRTFSRTIAIETGSAARTAIAWPPRVSRLAWPKGFPLKNGEIYHFYEDAMPLGSVRITEFHDAFDNDSVEYVRHYLEEECFRQAAALIWKFEN